MSFIKAFAIAAGAVATSSVAFAGPTHLSDAQYMAAARCQGLMASSALGKTDTSAIDAVIKSEGASRLPEVAERAAEARSDAKRVASHAGVQGRAALAAERDGVCQAWVHAPADTASMAARSSGAN